MTRLGDFWKFFAAIFFTKVVQIFVKLFGFFEKHHFLVKTAVATLWATLSEIGLLFVLLSNKCLKKWPSSTRCWVLNSHTLEHESPPITTRPELPPWKNLSYSLQFSFQVGNKADLDDRRAVTEEIARQFASERGMTYIETSAIKTVNIKEAFIGLLRPKL